LSEDKISSLLVDFDRKEWEGRGESGSEDESEDESDEDDAPQKLPGVSQLASSAPTHSEPLN